jgi:flagellar hook-length control protein FliK
VSPAPLVAEGATTVASSALAAMSTAVPAATTGSTTGSTTGATTQGAVTAAMSSATSASLSSPGVAPAGTTGQAGQLATAAVAGAVADGSTGIVAGDAATGQSAGTPTPDAGSARHADPGQSSLSPRPDVATARSAIAAGVITSVTADAGAATSVTRSADAQGPAAGTPATSALLAPTAATNGASVAASAPVLATGAAGPVGAPAWMQQALQSQLADRLVAAARNSGTGSIQRLTVHLHPADLGAVQVVATMDDGAVSLQLMAGNLATREALRASLAVLRHDLAAAGLDGTRLDVSDQAPSQQGTPQQQSGGWSDGSPRPFTGSGAAGPTASAGVTGIGHGPASVGADVRPRPPGHAQGVDLRL